jgi:KaiC/GvpD/RAD55 family RecA-like ATPase
MTTFQVVENKKLNLDIPKFLCDGNLAKHLCDIPMLANLNAFKFTCLLGKPGSGKTSVLISWLTGKNDKRVFRKVFNHILLVMPTSSRNSMKSNIFKNHDADKMYDELTYDTMRTIYDKLLASSEANETTLLILDDVGASLRNKSIAQLLRQIIYNRRHLKVHIVILLQSYLSIVKEIRKLINNVIMFKPSKIEAEYIFAELLEKKRDTSIDIINYAFTHDHDHLFLNVDNQRIFKNYNELIVNDNVEN